MSKSQQGPEIGDVISRKRYCITDNRIPLTVNSLCAQVTDKFCAFHVISVEFYNSANEMQGCVGNITVLFSHCIKKKATLEEV